MKKKQRAMTFGVYMYVHALLYRHVHTHIDKNHLKTHLTELERILMN